MITGEVKGYGLIDVIDYVLKKGLSGILHVECKEFKGEIHISDWKVVGAKTDHNTSDSAFMEMLMSDTVQFHVEETKNLENNITRNFTELLELAASENRKIQIGNNDIIKSVSGLNKLILTNPLQSELYDLCTEGLFFYQLPNLTGKTFSELRESISEMSLRQLVNVLSVKRTASVFLFPKMASMSMDQKEKDFFSQIYSGMSLYDLIGKSKFPPCQFADILTWLSVKKVLTISDENGVVLSAYHVRETLNIHEEECVTKLMVQSDKTLSSKNGTVRIDPNQMAFWQQVVFGKEIVAVSIEANGKQQLFGYDTGKKMPGCIGMTTQDMGIFGVSDMDNIDCKPVVKVF
jgi:hypothetical protein